MLNNFSRHHIIIGRLQYANFISTAGMIFRLFHRKHKDWRCGHGSDNLFMTKLINSVGIDHLGFYAMQKKT